MEGETVIPAPHADDDDDVAWALQTAAVQWQRGQRADAVVWLRRAVEASIVAGRAERTRELTRLAASVADRLVSEALAVPDSQAPPGPVDKHDSDVDELLARPSAPASKSVRPRASSHSMSDIPVEFDEEDAELIDDDLEDDLEDDFDEDDFDEDLDDRAPTLPPPDPVAAAGFRHELSSREYEYEDPSGSYVDAESVHEDSTLTGQVVKRIPSYDEEEEGDTESVVDSNEIFSHRPMTSNRPSVSSSQRSPAPSTRPSRNASPTTSQRPPVSSGRPPASRSKFESERPAVPRGSDRAPTPSSRPPGSDRPIEPIVTAEELFRQKEIENAKKKESEPPAQPGKVASPPKPSLPPPKPLAAPIVDDVSLDTVRGFEDLPEASQRSLAQLALLTTLSTDEEVGSFGAALVTRGRVGIMPAIADVASSVAKPGEIVFTRGTLSEGVPLRVVALENQTSVASWSDETLQAVMADCPWVADELRLVADRVQALAGAVLGPLGDRLDDALRDLVVSRLEVRTFGPNEIIVESGKPVPGLHVVGGGRVDLVADDGTAEEANAGDFLFAAEVLGAGRAHATARAGKAGALILFAPRSTAHELLLSVPTLIEILAG
jgi:CRP-like cAMP-binding protein